jgi:hypothetical protein
VSNNLTVIVVLVSVIHVVVFALMLWIRFRRSEADHTPGDKAEIRTCALCSEPAPYLVYDGLDPNETRDPATGRSYSADTAHYRPLCTAHASAGQQLVGLDGI